MSYKADNIPPPPKTDDYRERYRWYYRVFEGLNGILSFLSAASISATPGTTITGTDLQAVTNQIDVLVPSSGQKAGLVGTDGTPGAGNKYVTNSDPRNTDARTPTAHKSTHATGGTDVLTPADIGASTIDTTAITGMLKGNGTAISAAAAGSDYTSPTSTETMTNKRITRRSGNVASAATPTINTDAVDLFLITAQAEDITSFTTNLSGTPTEGQALQVAIKGTAARAITWGASFESSTVTLPATTVGTDRLDVFLIWNGATSKWRCIMAV